MFENMRLVSKEYTTFSEQKMLARIYINRHTIRANKKATKQTGQLVDEPAIAVKTYKGVTYCKSVEFKGKAKLVQNARNPICSGATIWLESQFEDVVLG